MVNWMASTPREIGARERVLAAGPRLGPPSEARPTGHPPPIERRDRMDAAAPGFLLELAADVELTSV
jgi:hypothetical protein